MKRLDLERWRAREVARLLALVEIERRYYQEIVASTPVGLAILDSKLGFLSANRAFRKIFGSTERVLATAKLGDLFPGGDVSSRAEEVLCSGQSQVNIFVNCDTEEGPKPLRLSLEPFRGWDDDPEAEVLLTIYDPGAGQAGPSATEAAARGAAIEQLVQAQKMAVLGRLADKVTHDCNNLLTIVNGYTEELRHSLPHDHPSQPDLDEILNATARLTRLTGELLQLTRRPSHFPDVFNLNSLLESYKDEIRRLLGKNS